VPAASELNQARLDCRANFHYDSIGLTSSALSPHDATALFLCYSALFLNRPELVSHEPLHKHKNESGDRRIAEDQAQVWHENAAEREAAVGQPTPAKSTHQRTVAMSARAISCAAASKLPPSNMACMLRNLLANQPLKAGATPLEAIP
jgi:hypothetical protein